jgi:hypothetical protein
MMMRLVPVAVGVLYSSKVTPGKLCLQQERGRRERHAAAHMQACTRASEEGHREQRAEAEREDA